MGPTDESFNWKGLRFFCGLAVSVLLVGVCLYVQAGRPYIPPTPPPTNSLVTTSQRAVSDSLHYQIPLRTIRKLTIADVVPPQGKFIAADLVTMQLSLYQDGTMVEQYPIKTRGRPGTPWETPAGLYKIQNKEENHFSSIGKVYMPYSMQFYGNYFIHGWTYYPDGTPTPFTFSGGCIKLETENAEKVFRFADVGTQVFVYDSKQTTPPPSLLLSGSQPPFVKAASWLVADLDTGDVFAEHNAQLIENPEYANILMSTLVANETISLDKKISVPEGVLTSPPDNSNTLPKTFLVNDLFYPLLLQANSTILDALASYNGRRNFVRSMNATAAALDMASTTFVSLDSPENVTTAEDLYRLAWYLTNKKSFVLKIASTQEKSIAAVDGSKYKISQSRNPATISVLPISVGDQARHVAIIVLNSPDQENDSTLLSNWISGTVRTGSQAACVSCAEPKYRKIDL